MRCRIACEVICLLVASMAVPAVVAAKPKEPSATQPSQAAATTTSRSSATMSQEGVIAGRYPYGTPQRLLITGRDGKELILLINPAATSMTKDQKSVTLAELPQDAYVKVQYTEKQGAQWLQTLEVLPGPAPAAKTPPTAHPSAPTAERQIPPVPPAMAPAASPEASAKIDQTHATSSSDTMIFEDAVPADGKLEESR